MDQRKARFVMLASTVACGFVLATGCASSPPPRQTVYVARPAPVAAPPPVAEETPVVEEWVRLDHRITFRANRATLTPEGESALSALADELRAHQVVQVRVDGHVNSGRQSPRGEELSVERARVVTDRLIEMGFAEDMFTTEGHGARELVDPDVHHGDQNRRVDLSALIRREG